MDAPDSRVGTTLGKYQVHELIGRGGMGVVYRAEHVYIGKEVAVKVLHHTFGTRDDAVKRFLREARAASLINHPNIVDVTDFGKTNDGTVFFAMELLKGCPLDALLMRERRLDLLRAISIMNQLTGALGAAHAKGIVHRDLKPENIMLIKRAGRRELLRDVYEADGILHTISEREGDYDFVKILDFGVAKVMEPDSNIKATQSGMVFGTPEYMAPETARVGSSDPRSDVYSLGIIFYEMLTGSVPFTGESPIDVMLQHVSAAPVPPRTRAPDAEITDTAERVIMKMIAKNPDERYQTMEEVYRDLQTCYGSVRYRRFAGPERGGPPIPLTRVIKRPASAAAQLDPMTEQLTEQQTAQQPQAQSAVAAQLATAHGAPHAHAMTTHGRVMREPIPLTKKKSPPPQSTAAAFGQGPRPTPPPQPMTAGVSPAPRPTPPPQPVTATGAHGPRPTPPPQSPHLGHGSAPAPLPADWDSVPPTPPPTVVAPPSASAAMKTLSGRPTPTSSVRVAPPSPSEYDSAPATPPPLVTAQPSASSLMRTMSGRLSTGRAPGEGETTATPGPAATATAGSSPAASPRTPEPTTSATPRRARTTTLPMGIRPTTPPSNDADGSDAPDER